MIKLIYTSLYFVCLFGNVTQYTLIFLDIPSRNVSVSNRSFEIISTLFDRKGILDANGRRKDVDREFAVYFTIVDENSSWYLDMNINTFAPRPDLVNKTFREFMTSNHMHSK